MKNNKDKTFSIMPDIRFRILDHEAVVVRQNTNEIMALNETASRALKLIQQGETFGNIIHQLLTEYEVDQTTLEPDLCECLINLESLGIIKEN